jgi:hypothetical protein
MAKLYIWFSGNLEDEEKVLAWLEHQVKSDEIEDITDEMLDMLIDKMPHVAVLFCECYFIDLKVKTMYCVSKCSDYLVCNFNSWICKFPHVFSLQKTQMGHLFYFSRKYIRNLNNSNCNFMLKLHWWKCICMNIHKHTGVPDVLRHTHMSQNLVHFSIFSKFMFLKWSLVVNWNKRLMKF